MMAEALRILCCGSITLDVAAEPIVSPDDPPGAVRRRGRVSANVGGGAFNIAMDLRAHGADAALLSAVNERPLALMFRAAMVEAGIEPELHVQPELPDAVFVGRFQDGDLVEALASRASETADIPDELIGAVVGRASAVILTLALPQSVCLRIAKAAHAAGRPLFVSVNSEARVARFPQLAAYAQVAFFNHVEAEVLCRKLGVSSPHGAADTLGCSLVVTSGAEGLCLYEPEGLRTEVPTQPLPVTGNTLGAGDLIVAATAYFHVCEGLPLTQAVAWAPARMAELLKRTEAYLPVV